MWAVIGVWEFDPEVLGELRPLLPAMAQGKLELPGFLHGTWTVDGHVMQVYDDEVNARRYHQDMIMQGAVERPGQRCIVWDVAEVGAESAVERSGEEAS